MSIKHMAHLVQIRGLSNGALKDRAYYTYISHDLKIFFGYHGTFA